MAYAIARAEPRRRPLLLMLVILPFWTSFLIRVYAWMGLLAENGILNQFLRGTGLAADPGTILGTEWAVHLGIVYAYLPFMVLPLYAALEKLDTSLLEAAADLGARPFAAFLTITLPLSLPGIVAGCLLVFIPAVGEFVIPDLLGGTDTLMIGKVLWDEFFTNADWPLASAVAICLLVLLVGPIALFQRQQAQKPGAPLMVGRARFALAVLAFGYAFLYLPLVLVIAYSFNESRLVTVWAGFSTKWWSALFANEAMLRAAWLSLRIAVVSATAAAVIGPGRGLRARPRAAPSSAAPCSAAWSSPPW